MNTYHNRRITSLVKQDLGEKMVLLARPRQAGKTTLANQIMEESKSSVYYTWDDATHRKLLQKNQLDPKAVLWVFDELHKYRHWRNWLKGVYDLNHPSHQMLVTGSAKLDIYRRGSDSLQGRYYSHRLHPFTFSEYFDLKTPNSFMDFTLLSTAALAGSQEAIEALMNLGGFPEPPWGGSEKKAARWRLAYGSRLVQGDIRSVEAIKDLDKVELLFDRLPECVGSVLSINSLREDLEVSYPTVKNWINVLERFYACFRVAPFGPPRLKAVKKEQKLYLWNPSSVEDPAARFENLIALHLLRLVHWLSDVEGEKVELRYFRNTVGQEVDFIILRKQKPWIACEVKLDDRPLDPNLKYFLERVQVPYAFQVSLKGQLDYRPEAINSCQVRVCPAALFLANLA